MIPWGAIVIYITHPPSRNSRQSRLFLFRFVYFCLRLAGNIKKLFGETADLPVGPAGLSHEDDAVHCVAEKPFGAVKVVVEVVEEAVVVARLALHLQGYRLQVARLARNPAILMTLYYFCYSH